MVRRGDSNTLTESVYDELHRAILSGEYGPEERLKPSVIREQYGVSLSVVREALTRLAEQRLAVIEPNRGFRVVSCDDKSIADLLEHRLILECAALELSIERGDTAWEAEVLASHHRLSAADAERTDPGPTDAWSAAHADFHLTLFSACANERLIASCTELFLAGGLMRQWSRRFDQSASRRDLLSGHTEILQAVLARDAGHALALYRTHLLTTNARAAGRPTPDLGESVTS